MTWWLWIVLGVVLTAIELATEGGFFAIFFGVGAFAVGLLSAIGILREPWQHWLLFPVIALLGLRLFRKPLLERIRRSDPGQDNMDTLLGEVAVVAETIAPGGHGRAELRGTTWSVRNAGDVVLAVGQRCRVIAVQGLMLDLQPE